VGAPTADLRFVIDVRDVSHLNAVLRTLARTAHVNKAKRISG
jgi:(p)ppGpp synthase/HD superfamily hydrolase